MILTNHFSPTGRPKRTLGVRRFLFITSRPDSRTPFLKTDYFITYKADDVCNYGGVVQQTDPGDEIRDKIEGYDEVEYRSSDGDDRLRRDVTVVTVDPSPEQGN